MNTFFKRILAALSLAALPAAPILAQAPSMPQPERPSIKRAVIKGTAPLNKDTLKVKLPKPYETKLGNGLQVLVLEDHKLPNFNMQMVILSGGMADSDQEVGTAQTVATMIREGTKTRSSKQIAEDTDRLGATIFSNASLASITSTVSASGLTDNFDQILDLFADVILNPSFPADELAKLKTRSLAQIRLQRSQASFLAQEKFSKVMYGSHPAGRFALTAEQIQRFTPEILQKFHGAHYRPNNAIFAIVGHVKAAEVVAKLEKTFASWKPGEAPRTEIPKVADTGPGKIIL